MAERRRALLSYPTEVECTLTLLEELQVSMTSQQLTEDDSPGLGDFAIEADNLQPLLTHSTLRPSDMVVPSPTHSSTAIGHDLDDSNALVRDTADRQDWFHRHLNESDLHWRTQGVHSPAARKVITEINSELQKTHDALMNCLYDTTDSKDREETKAKKTDQSYRWTPSEKELRRPCAEGYDEENTYDGGRERREPVDDQIDVDASQANVAHLRGGGVQRFLGLSGRSKEPSSVPQRPQLISRPSEAFSRMANQGAGVSNTNPPARVFQPIRTLPARSQGSRLQQLQQSSVLRPPSLISADGSHPFSAYAKTASIVPEGSVASYSMGFQSRPATTHELEASKESHVPVAHVSQVPASEGREDHGQSHPGEPSPGRFDHPDGTVRNVQSMAKLSGTNLYYRSEAGSPSFVSSRRAVGTMDVERFTMPEEKDESLDPAPKLGSPMQTPVTSTWRNFSRPPTIGSIASTERRAEGPTTFLDPQEETRKTFFAPKGNLDLNRVASQSLRDPRRGRAPDPANPSSLPPTGSHHAERELSEQNAAATTDVYRTSWLQADANRMAADRSHRSLWNGGDHLSLAPGDSSSEVGALQAGQAALRHGVERGLVAGTAHGLVEETREVYDPRAKKESEDRFRDALRRMWSTHQTRMRLISEDATKTGEEKKAAAKEEQRYLELEIGQASADTGFEQLHEPWQKDELIKNLFGMQTKPSKAPSFLRKTNKVMKWILAVPDDPELKTHSSRKPRVSLSKPNTVFPSFRRNRTSMRESRRAGSSHDHGPEAQQGGAQDMAALSPNGRRRFHFAPVPAIHGKTMHQVSFETLGDDSEAVFGQVKVGKMSYKPSVASSETAWPTQSQAGAKE